MTAQELQNVSFVAGRIFTLHGVVYSIGDPVDVTGVSFHRLRQMMASRHLRVSDKVDPVDPVEPVEPVEQKTRSKRAA